MSTPYKGEKSIKSEGREMISSVVKIVAITFNGLYNETIVVSCQNKLFVFKLKIV